MRIVVTGSRDWPDAGFIGFALGHIGMAYFGSDERVTLVQGGARGADHYAWEWAMEHGWAVETFAASWNLDGRGAGIMRNVRMLDAGADIVLAFICNESRGATHCSRLAIERGMPTIVYRMSSIGSPIEATMYNMESEGDSS